MTLTLRELLPLLAELCENRDARRSLAQLAAEAGTSASHFQRAFARLVGDSPKQYTLRLQLEWAAARLLTTSDSVLDVALAVGFDSHEGFTRAFSRHFGVAPRAFRTRGVESGLTDQARHAAFIKQIGPCVGLFRTVIEKGEFPMNYDITQQPVDAMTLVAGTARCEQAKIAEVLAKLLPASFQYVTQAGIAMVGPPTTLYTDWGPGMVTLTAGIQVAPGSKGAGEMQAVELPPGDAAVTVHTGPYDGLGDAHAAVEVFLHENGLTRSGAIREVYLTDPGEVPNPADWKTQVVWPLSS